MIVDVRNNNIDRALKVMKRKLVDEGIYKEMQKHRFYEKPSEKRNRRKREGISRQRKAAAERKALEAQ
jgi:small subunit ribosomal protein S21